MAIIEPNMRCMVRACAILCSLLYPNPGCCTPALGGHGYLLVFLLPWVNITSNYELVGHHHFSKGLVTQSRILDDCGSSYTEKIEAFVHEHSGLYGAANLYPLPPQPHILIIAERFQSQLRCTALIICYSINGLEFLTNFPTPFILMVTCPSFTTSG